MNNFRYLELETWLREGITNGRWKSGARLPSIRQLCEDHKVSKATVQHALHRLEAQRLVIAKPKSGYFIPHERAVKVSSKAQVTNAPTLITVSDVLIDVMSKNAAFDLMPSFVDGEKPSSIVALNRSLTRALRRQKGHLHQYYDVPAGDIHLRKQLAEMMHRRDCAAQPEELCITNGCQHALFLALMATCQAGDVVAVESPGFYGALQLLEQLQLKVIEIPASYTTGIDIAALESNLNVWPIKAIIVTPNFSTPTGSLMPNDNRTKLLALAEKFDFAVIEDDIYGEMGFHSATQPLAALDEHSRVISCSSFSKSLSRDLRIGWIKGARWHEKIIKLKLITQLASSSSTQQGLCDYIADGSYHLYLRRQKQTLLQQRDQLLTYLCQNWSFADYTVPEGGISLWVTLPEHCDTMQLYSQLSRSGITIIPGPIFSISNQFKSNLRLSFNHQWTEERIKALNILKKYIS